MTFLYPLGFLALLGIPVLILIYIIKNRYTEQTIASTYLWTLSEKFLKRRIPINRLTGILSLILQILAVILIAVIVAHPIITVDGAANSYCFILDGSGSMNISVGGETRFNAGKEQIKQIINGSMDGSNYTLILAGGSTETIFERYNDKSRATEALDELGSGFEANGLGDALIAAQQYFNENPSVQTYLVTDKTYGETKNIKLINVNGGSENYALSDVDYMFTVDGNLRVTGNAVSYGSDASVTVELRLDGGAQVASSAELELVSGEKQSFELSAPVSDFVSFEVTIPEPDALLLDSTVTIFNIKHENMSRTLLVSDGSIYLRAALRAVGNTQLDVINQSEYKDQTGYGLYIFEGFVPDKTPQDGAVWYVDPVKSPEGANFSYSAPVNNPSTVVYSTESKTSVRKMLEGVQGSDFLLKKYSKLSTSGGDFTVYARCEGNPVIFTGSNAYGNREAVFAFSMRDSAGFTLSMDFTTILTNMMSFSFPEVVDETYFTCGDMLQVNMIAGCSGVRIVSPLGNESYPDANTVSSEYKLTEVGTYNIYLIMSDGTEREVKVYSALPEEERAPVAEETSFIIQGEPEAGGLPGIFDNLIIIFVILAVVVAADYGVYCYEQYQLR